MEHHNSHRDDTDNCHCACCWRYIITTICEVVMFCSGMLILGEGELIIGVIITVAGFLLIVEGITDRNSSRCHVSHIKKPSF